MEDLSLAISVLSAPLILFIIFGNFPFLVIIFRRWKLLNLNTWLIGQLAYSCLLFPHPLSWKYFLFPTVCLTFLTSSLFRMLWGLVFFLLCWQWRDTIWFLNLLCTWKSGQVSDVESYSQNMVSSHNFRYGNIDHRFKDVSGQICL